MHSISWGGLLWFSKELIFEWAKAHLLIPTIERRNKWVCGFVRLHPYRSAARSRCGRPAQCSRRIHGWMMTWLVGVCDSSRDAYYLWLPDHFSSSLCPFALSCSVRWFPLHSCTHDRRGDQWGLLFLFFLVAFCSFLPVAAMDVDQFRCTWWSGGFMWLDLWLTGQVEAGKFGSEIS